MLTLFNLIQWVEGLVVRVGVRTEISISARLWVYIHRRGMDEACKESPWLKVIYTKDQEQDEMQLAKGRSDAQILAEAT
jgi:hypothetical protein